MHHTRPPPPAATCSTRASSTGRPRPWPRARRAVAMPRMRQPSAPSGPRAAARAAPSPRPRTLAGAGAAWLATVDERPRGLASGRRRPGRPTPRAGRPGRSTALAQGAHHRPAPAPRGRGDVPTGAPVAADSSRIGRAVGPAFGRPNCNLFQVRPGRRAGRAWRSATPRNSRPCARSCATYYANLLTPEVEEELSPQPRHRARPCGGSPSRWPATAGWGSAGPRSTAARAARPSSSSSSSTSRCAAGRPVPMLTINTVGPTIMNFGTDEQKEFFLPKILAGEIHFCIGYSEPEAGTDLAALQTRGGGRRRRARHQRRQDLHQPGRRRRLLLAGGAHRPRGLQAQGHLHGDRPHGHARGPGGAHAAASATTTSTTPSGRTSASRSPTWSAGSTTAGRLITNQLNHERVTLCSPGHHRAGPGRRPRMGPGHQARRRAARHRPGVGAHRTWPGCTPSSSSCRLINWKVAWTATQGRLDVADASSHQGVRHRVLHGGAAHPVRRWSGQSGYLRRGSAEEVLHGRLEAYTAGPGHPHLRRRDQRDPARPHRHLRPGHAPVAALEPRADDRGLLLHRGAGGRPGAGGPHLLRPLHPRAPARRSRPPTSASTASCGRELGSAGLLGIWLPESVGGAGLGFVAAGIVAEEAGRDAAAVPFVASRRCSAPAPIARVR